MGVVELLKYQLCEILECYVENFNLILKNTLDLNNTVTKNSKSYIPRIYIPLRCSTVNLFNFAVYAFFQQRLEAQHGRNFKTFVLLKLKTNKFQTLCYRKQKTKEKFRVVFEN